MFETVLSDRVRLPLESERLPSNRQYGSRNCYSTGVLQARVAHPSTTVFGNNSLSRTIQDHLVEKNRVLRKVTQSNRNVS